MPLQIGQYKTLLNLQIFSNEKRLFLLRQPNQNGKFVINADKHQVEVICVDFKSNSIAGRRMLTLKHAFEDVVLHHSSVILVTEETAHSLEKQDIAEWLFSEEEEPRMEQVNDNNLYLRIVKNKNDQDESFRGAFQRV